MALQDILHAISAEADKRISDMQAAHQRELTRMREESERNLARKKQEFSVQKLQKMEQLKNKTLTHASTQRRNAVLLKKRVILDAVYESLAKKMAAMSDEELEPLLRACIKSIHHKGTIHPSAKHEKLLKKICPAEQFDIKESTKASGGFLFVSAKEERDFTFDSLVAHSLRPQTELETSHMLFT